MRSQARLDLFVMCKRCVDRPALDWGSATLQGETLQPVDIRLERSFPIRETMKLDVLGEIFNLTNTVNIRYFNTTYGASDFCPADPAGCVGSTHGDSLEGSPNLRHGIMPSSVNNPRQVRLAVRLMF